jgi:LysM repeat protein
MEAFSMLDQYRQDNLSSDTGDFLSEDRFRMSRQKLLFILVGSSLALLFFLFMLGTFRKDESEKDLLGRNEVAQELRGPPDRPQMHNLRAELESLERRISRLEGLSSTTLPIAEQTNRASILLPETEPFIETTTSSPTAPHRQEDLAIMTDQALKQLIARETPNDVTTFSSHTLLPEVSAYPEGIADETTPSNKPSTTARKDAPKNYVVQKGDTLSQISMRLYGTPNRWRSIYELNRDRIPNINKLKVGTSLILPPESRNKE